jgi:methionyl-tRNA formyltransferase
MKIIFMGTPDFAVPALRALINSTHEIVAVYTAAPKPAGRGKQLRQTAVHEVAEAEGLEVRIPASLKAEQLPECDVAVVVAYGLLLPQHILGAPKHGCLNIHPSALPRWRGAAPIQRTIMAGDDASAVCIMQMDAGLDTGAVLMREDFALSAQITAGELHDKCAEIGAKLTLQTINSINSLKAIPQVELEVTYAKKITKEDERSDWTKTARQIDCQIRGLNPFPSAYFEHRGEKIKVFGCEVVDASGEAGLALDGALTIACGQGAICITELQKAGKRRMNAKDFLAGNKIPTGTKLQ